MRSRKKKVGFSAPWTRMKILAWPPTSFVTLAQLVKLDFIHW